MEARALNSRGCADERAASGDDPAFLARELSVAFDWPVPRRCEASAQSIGIAA